MVNAFTVDLEDWYHGVGIPISEWDKYEKRIRIGSDKLLEILAQKKVKATFFVLGKVIEEHPKLIEDIIHEGHEIGCHGYTHMELFNINKDLFLEEIIKCKHLIDEFGVAFEGYRAPYFSIDNRSLWALKVLFENGFTYDASIFPGDSKRTGIKGYKKSIHLLENGLWEVPVTTFPVLNFDFGTGGAYFRIIPFSNFAKAMYRQNNQSNPFVFYIHPWELDEKHPYLSFLSLRRRIPHYWNLDKTLGKLNLLLDNFQFAPVNTLIKIKKKDGE